MNIGKLTLDLLQKVGGRCKPSRGFGPTLPSSLSNFKGSVWLTLAKNTLSVDGKRFFTRSILSYKRDKYSLKFLPVHRGKGSGGRSKGSQNSTGPSIFQLDKDKFWNSKDVSFESAKMAVVAKYIHEAIASLISSSDVPDVIQQEPIEVVKVIMAPSLNTANVYWRLGVAHENLEREKHVENLLEEYIDNIQMMLPTYHTMTCTPYIHFKLYTADRRKREMENLLARIHEDIT